ncbi:MULTISPECIES: PDDEXK nuclease domain-containing protein [Candidatus Accumulibacter]|uniref:PDDEXK nuclease domain-containing protein n=1 Tax=Candidatus Accumulibacter TaxID=327159 RepID=UPI0025C1098D|nr:PDDEXK nuclease domain-containing protein [Candidatus Accumulibacter sp. ACC012]
MRTLRLKIVGMLYQRTALSKKPQAVISAEIGKLGEGPMSPDIVFRDPYLLDLLGLTGAYIERDLESAILREIECVLLELGTGFAFVARQKRLSVGKDDFHLDPLFFHRHLRWLDKYERELAKKRQSVSSCAHPPTPSRSNCFNSTPSPSASASTAPSYRRCHCCANGCTRR